MQIGFNLPSGGPLASAENLTLLNIDLHVTRGTGEQA